MCDKFVEDPLNRLHNSFTYHSPKPGQNALYEEIRSTALKFAILIHTTCPPSREKSLAITKLEEAVMWANKSIACNS